MPRSKRTKTKSKRVKVKSTKQAVVKNERGQRIGLSEKISRLFYNWVKKRTNTRKLVNEKYELIQQIGQGTFGMVYLAKNIYTSVAVAVKLEYSNTPHAQLKYESKIYEKLGSQTEGFIEIYFFGQYGKQFNALCMELLGPDLDDLFVACNRHFSLKTVLMIGIRVLKLMKHIHSCNIVYRDIKPENFCIGHHYNQKEKTIFIVDFGLSIMYESKIPKQTEDEYNYLIGTARYMSTNALRGGMQSRNDDLESIAYMLVYFLYGRLPWMGLSTNHSDMDYLKILKMKEDATPDELCPDCAAIAAFLEYSRNLTYSEEPNYSYLLKILEKEMKKNKYENDGIFDWTEMMGKNYLTGALIIDPDA